MKTINLSESAYNKLINEISYGTVEKAKDRANDLFYEVRTSFEDFYAYLNDAIFKSKYESSNGTANPYLIKIQEIADTIYDILAKKRDQQEYFNDEVGKVDYNKFFDSDEGY